MTTAIVIGGGPSGLMAADVLSAAGCDVTIADQMPSVGRKLLMAGKSGLNLTKNEPVEQFLQRYPKLPEQVTKAIHDFGPKEVWDWAQELGQELFVGSTGRVFPKKMKASPLLRAWLKRLEAQGVQMRTRWRWTGWSDAGPTFETPEGPVVRKGDITILALGGGSWRRLGSDGEWVKHFDGVRPFQPSNCGFCMDWSEYMRPFFGKAVKNIGLQAGSLKSRGEFVITEKGIEGGGVYEVSAAMRDGAMLYLDLLPDITKEDLSSLWSKRRPKASTSQVLKATLRLPREKIALVNEMQNTAGRISHLGLPMTLKALPLSHNGPQDLDGAISTAGGLSFEGLTNELMLRSRPGIFCAGEMLDWDAPTGGYLLTACLATGRLAGRSALQWATSLESRDLLA